MVAGKIQAGTRVKVSPKQYHVKQRITARSPKRFTTPVHATGMSPLVLGAVEAAAKPGDVDAPFGKQLEKSSFYHENDRIFAEQAFFTTKHGSQTEVPGQC